MVVLSLVSTVFISDPAYSLTPDSYVFSSFVISISVWHMLATALLLHSWWGCEVMRSMCPYVCPLTFQKNTSKFPEPHTDFRVVVHPDLLISPLYKLFICLHNFFTYCLPYTFFLTYLLPNAFTS